MNKDTIPANTYDVTPKVREIIEWRAKRRLELRNLYLKEVHNPNPQTDGGAIFDPQYQRHYSSYNAYEKLWKPKIKSFLWFSGLLFGSWGAVYFFIKHYRDEQENKYRTGLVSYRDREAKFV